MPNSLAAFVFTSCVREPLLSGYQAEPYEMKRISSLVEQVYKDENVDSDIVQTIKTVNPARTFLEKAFLLCEEY